MGQFFYTATDGTKYRVNLLPLADYEADGGSYGDEDGEVTAADFVAAVVVDERDGDEWSPCYDTINAMRDLGVEHGRFWRDAANGWLLVMDWPAESPLQSRMVG